MRPSTARVRARSASEGSGTSEIAGPGPAVAAVLPKIGGDLQGLGLVDRNQFLRKLVAHELVVVDHARQLQPVKLLVLAHQHVVGAGEHGTPTTKPNLIMAGKGDANHGVVAVVDFCGLRNG